MTVAPMPIQFLDISGNRQLALFTKMLAMIGQSQDNPRELYRSLVSMMRQAFDTRCYVEVSTEGLKPGSYRITRMWREDGREAVPNRTPWMIDSVPVREGGIIAEVVTRAEPLAINRLEVDVSDVAYSELREYQSLAASPGGMGEWHNWVLVLDTIPDAFTPEDVEVLSLRVSLVGLSLKNLQTLAELRAAKSMIDAEVDRIAEIQRSLLPPDSPNVPGLEVAAKFETFDRAGGDMYDYAHLRDGNWGFMVADASGHGPSAAVVSAMLNAILHTLPAAHGQRATRPADVLCYANVQMSEKRVEQSFVTAFVGVWNPDDSTFTFARAGHPIPLLRRGSKVSTLGDEGDLPLGIFEETSYGQSVQKLSPGDVIVLYTDGVTEARNEAGEMFGEARLKDAMSSAGPSASDVLDSIWSAMFTHQASSTPKDDQTVLVLKVK